MNRPSTPVSNGWLRFVPGFLGLIVVLIMLGMVLSFTGQFFYVFERVEQNEVGVKFRGGQIVDFVAPGVYSDFGLYVEIKRVSSQAVRFEVSDDEIITADKQRIGLVVAGDAFRPGLAGKDILRDKWAQYSGLFLHDADVQDRVKGLTQQAMKVCVGERNFDDAIIGTARDVLRECIDTELSKLAENYGLQIENVAVPNVVLSPDAQAALDAIVQSRLATEKANQDKLKAEAEAEAEKARQIGEIQVEQARIQEEAKQQTTLAQLEQAKLAAQKAVIEAQKANDLLAAQQDLEINKALALAAAEKAKGDLAQQITLAQLYANSPAYLQLLTVQANAAALKPTDKIIFTPEGTTPTIVLPGPGIVPTVDTTPATPQPQ